MDNKIKNTVELIKNVLSKGYLMSLATTDDGGVWVADVIFVYDDKLNIYWMSDPNVRHSKAVLKNNQVAGTITTSGPKEKNSGIQFSGIVEKIDGPRPDLAKMHYAKRGKSEPSPAEDVLQGDSWYILKPKLMQLTYEKVFGFDKKNLKLK